MALTASSLVIAFALSTGASDAPVVTAPAQPVVAVSAPATLTTQLVASRPAPLANAKVEAWMVDQPVRRPAALPAMYAALGALQVMDVYSTRRAIDAGAYEANPLMRKAAGNSNVMMAVKAASTAGAIYFTERAWKKNKKGAVILMAAINGATAAIVMRNLRNAR